VPVLFSLLVLIEVNVSLNVCVKSPIVYAIVESVSLSLGYY
jgi:hypothetical protein